MACSGSTIGSGLSARVWRSPGGLDELRRNLEPLASGHARFDYTILRVVEADGIALMHTEWTVSHPQRMRVHAVEVARKQADGSWRWLIGDPFTVREHNGTSAVPTGTSPAPRGQ